MVPTTVRGAFLQEQARPVPAKKSSGHATSKDLIRYQPPPREVIVHPREIYLPSVTPCASPFIHIPQVFPYVPPPFHIPLIGGGITPRSTPRLVPPIVMTPIHSAKRLLYLPTPPSLPEESPSGGFISFQDEEEITRKASVGRELARYIFILTASAPSVCDVEIDMKITGIVSVGVWRKQLGLYEARQRYLAQQFEQGSAEAVRLLNELERWFVAIVEPAPDRGQRYYLEETAEWAEREAVRNSRSPSSYCDERVRHLIYR